LPGCREEQSLLRAALFVFGGDLFKGKATATADSFKDDGISDG
jgi:hypothetical protein